ncbi:arylsulfotransferase family protein [Colwellia sp. E2M01]|uniref:arylsulfotransferase family protein n=1 Tax=Colwellia sp. E2M01 TaxID=2841561 RepID=UPI001C092593|nr:arylsulfotransferase family protein [Colwellia sp. E2M01]MBU2870952.1 arylsulfotransferase family protein [Colwellia sp. E2M01]
MKMFEKLFFIASCIMIIFSLGIISNKFSLFPSRVFDYLYYNSEQVLKSLNGELPWYYVKHEMKQPQTIENISEIQPGLTLITSMGTSFIPNIKVINQHGVTIKSWQLNWFDIWSESTHIPENMIPKSLPGTHIHGSKLLSNGDILFNFENLGLVRVDICGNVVWKLSRLTHHSVNQSVTGDFWIPSQIRYQNKLEGFPNLIPPFKDDFILKVSPKGDVLKEISIASLLRDNGYEGLLYLSTIKSRDTSVTGDLFHLNDIEEFPPHLKEGLFSHGDLLVSLRNISTVLVFDPTNLEIKFISTGLVTRQHDPDFIDGNTISVFDNNTSVKGRRGQSHIVFIDALSGQKTNYFSGTNKIPFYSNIMGKHQWLNNGNLLLTEAMNGRLIEISPQKKLVWEYINFVDNPAVAGIIEGGERLSEEFDINFFQQKQQECEVR